MAEKPTHISFARYMQDMNVAQQWNENEFRYYSCASRKYSRIQQSTAILNDELFRRPRLQCGNNESSKAILHLSQISFES
jgi:hypothetical protein